MANSVAALGYTIAPNRGSAGPTPPEAASPSSRGWTICVGDSSVELAGRAVATLRENSASNPLLGMLSGGRAAQTLRTRDAGSLTRPELAYNNVLVIGLPGDPLVESVWQREALLNRDGSLYIFGFGNLAGSIGYIESNRNPLLHAAAIPFAPYEAQLTTITGTDVAGLSLAVDTFLRHSLVNGVVAAAGWRRTGATLLDRDPLPAGFTIPPYIPASLGNMERIALTMASEDEYRGVLEDAGVKPNSIWRAKYYRPGVWDLPRATGAFRDYAAGFHRRAYGNTIWTAEFDSRNTATDAAPRIANAAHLRKDGAAWTGSLPPYAWGLPVGDAPATGTLRLWTADSVVFMSAELNLNLQNEK